MILIAFLIFFKAIPPRLSFLNHKKSEKNEESCGNFQDIQISNFKFCQSGEYLKFTRCTFTEATIGSQVESDNIIHSQNVNLNLESCQFQNCNFAGSIIYCEDQNLIMYSNSINNCLNQNSPNSEIQIIKTAATTNDIQGNNITFLNTNHLCRAYQIKTFSNTIFKNNRIEKAHQTIGSALYFNSIGTGTPLEILGCLISNCVGGNCGIMAISDKIPFFHLYNTTFEYFTNNVLSGGRGSDYFFFHLVVDLMILTYYLKDAFLVI